MKKKKKNPCSLYLDKMAFLKKLKIKKPLAGNIYFLELGAQSAKFIK